MSRVISSQWPGNEFAPYRRGRTPCDYEAYVPDLLTGRPIRLDGDVAAEVTDAEAFALADTEALARLLLRAESVASSRIEGLEVGARKLLLSEAVPIVGERSLDYTANEGLH